MRYVRFVPLVAAGLVVMLAASTARAEGPTSVVNNPEFLAGAVEDPGAVLGTWINAAAMPEGLVRYAHAQCLGENSFYVFSGVTSGGQLTNASRRYDAATNSWALLAPIPTGAEGPSGVCHNGKIYVAGGSTTATTLFIYDIATNAWTTGAPVPRASWGAAMGADSNRIFVIGGDPDFFFGGVSNQVNIYDIATNTWSLGAPMPTATGTAGFAQIDTFVYVVGGWGNAAPATNVNLTQRYDMATNTWELGPTFTSGRADLPVAATSTALYAIGGDSNGGGPFDITTVVERLDLSTWPAGAWAAADPLPSARGAHKGGFCTTSFFPATGEVWSTGGIATPFPTFSTTNQYLQAEACPGSTSVAPAALAVDPAPGGNGVLEPNEASVTVAPSWENTGSSAIAALTGAATTFTGPPGATYTIDDAAADYGAVAAGATVSCTSTGNCYAVTVTAATRPLVHWDSVLSETVTPPGTTHDWTLHIGESFTDVPTSNPFYRFIETLLHHAVTAGCTATEYCPTASTSREQMAVFALTAKEGQGYAPPDCVSPNLYQDVPETSPFCRWIEELTNRGVVSGCGNNNYCPQDPVTREQMAVFMLRTLDPALVPPPCAPPNLFADVPETSGFCRWIEELANRGVVTGCGGGNYCPTDPVTREQMGVFISVTFGLLLYGV